MTRFGACTTFGFFLAWLGGCASQPVPAPTRSFLPYQLAPQPSLVAPEPSVARSSRQAETIDEPGTSLGSALIRFALAQRRARETPAAAGNFSALARQNWAAIIADLDRFLDQPTNAALDSSGKLEMVRTRVTLDAELELDEEYYGVLPDGLAASVKARMMALDSRLAGLRRPESGMLAESAMLGWPIEPVVVTSLFGMRADPFRGEYQDHTGVDLRAYKGQLVQSVADGTVIRAGWAGGYGLHVEVDHGHGLMTTYSHLCALLVSSGMHVPAMGPLGLAGNTGRSTGPHLHFEVWRNGWPVDPLSELSISRISRDRH